MNRRRSRVGHKPQQQQHNGPAVGWAVAWRRLLCVGAAVVFAAVRPGPSQAAEALPGKVEIAPFSKPDGESFFALGFEIETPRASEEPRDIVILVDTSASQARGIRDKGLETVKLLLGMLRPRDAVMIYAVDIDPVPLTSDFVGPQSPQAEEALAKLKARTPLGATDLPAALGAVLTSFSKRPPAPRAAIYVGDGMSTANLLPVDVLKAASQKLNAARVPLSSFAIGPRLDTLLLGALANHTGGVVAVDYVDVDAKKYALFLSNAIRADVFWPINPKLPGNVVEFFPEEIPPLRTDRATILIGRGKFAQATRIEWEVVGWGKSQKLGWTVEPKPSDDVNTYLVELIHGARKHKGWGLPLAGVQGLIEARLSLDADLRKLLVLGRQALAMSRLDQAEQLGRRALEIDAHSPEASQLIAAVKVLWFEDAKKAIAEKRPEQAAQALLHALRIDPEYAPAKKLLEEISKPGEGKK